MLYVAIIEDNPQSGELLKEYIEGEDIKVSAVYASGEDAVSTMPTRPLPDVVLVDIGLPGMSGIEVIRWIKERYPEVELIAQTVFEDTKTIVDTIKAGASGYILKASPKEEYSRALREVKRGGSFLTGKVARKILHEFQRTGDEFKSSIEEFHLTGREEEILRELVKGLSYKEISDKLNISFHTVNNHIRNIYQKLQVNSRGEAAARVTGR